MRETAVERYLKRQCEAKGYPCRKQAGTRRRGTFDRVVLRRSQRVVWIETKAPGKKLSQAQQREKEFLESMGHVALWIHTKELVDQFVKDYL